MPGKRYTEKEIRSGTMSGSLLSMWDLVWWHLTFLNVEVQCEAGITLCRINMLCVSRLFLVLVSVHWEIPKWWPSRSLSAH